MADGWIAFWVMWAFCGVSNMNAYADEIDITGHRLTIWDALICVALGPITTVVGVTARVWSLVVHHKYALPKALFPLKPGGEE